MFAVKQWEQSEKMMTRLRGHRYRATRFVDVIHNHARVGTCLHTRRTWMHSTIWEQHLAHVRQTTKLEGLPVTVRGPNGKLSLPL